MENYEKTLKKILSCCTEEIPWAIPEEVGGSMAHYLLLEEKGLIQLTYGSDEIQVIKPTPLGLNYFELKDNAGEAMLKEAAKATAASAAESVLPKALSAAWVLLKGLLKQ